MPDPIISLGLIAGSRSLPFMVAQGARRAGIQNLVAVAFENETDPALAQEVNHITWLKVGQLSALIDTFQKHGVKHCIMAGQIAPKNLWDLRPDLRALKILMRIKERNAHSLFGAIADELQNSGIELVPAIPWLKPHMPSKGFTLGPPLDADTLDDARFGLRIAREVSRLEIGQTVVVKNGSVLAVEAFEGTDPCLERGGKLAGKNGGAVAIKLAKPNHDMRFDIPCVGPTTIETCAKHGIKTLILEPDRCVLLDEAKVRILAKEHRLSIACLESGDGV